MTFRAGRRRDWRFASFALAGAAIIAAAVLGACASARLEIVLPDPRPSAADIVDPSTDSLEIIDHHRRSVVTGSIRFLPRDAEPVALGATVVYLRPKSAGADPLLPATGLVRIESTTSEFSPPPSIVRPRQRVTLENRGPLVHRLFTSQLENTVLALDPGERSESFRLPTRGTARFYCSLHADETFVVFVEDAPHVALISDTRAYEFAAVAPGRYTLAIWSERVSGPVREVYVDGYTRAHEPIWLVSTLIEP